MILPHPLESLPGVESWVPRKLPEVLGFLTSDHIPGPQMLNGIDILGPGVTPTLSLWPGKDKVEIFETAGSPLQRLSNFPFSLQPIALSVLSWIHLFSQSG